VSAVHSVRCQIAGQCIYDHEYHHGRSVQHCGKTVLHMLSLIGGKTCNLCLKTSFIDTGVWTVDEASSENLASFDQILCQHDIFGAIKSQIFHSATAQQWTRLGDSPEWQKHTPTKQLAQAPEYTFSYSAPLLAKIRRCLYEACVRWKRFCAFHSMLTYRSR